MANLCGYLARWIVTPFTAPFSSLDPESQAAAWGRKVRWYACGVTWLIRVKCVRIWWIEHDIADPDSLQVVPAFQAFMADLADRCDVSPVATEATLVGGYR